MQWKPSSSNRQLISPWLQIQSHSCYQLNQPISSVLSCHFCFCFFAVLCQWVQVQRRDGWGNKNAANAVESADGSDSTVRKKKKKAWVSRAKISVTSEIHSTIWWAMGSDDHPSLIIDFGYNRDEWKGLILYEPQQNWFGFNEIKWSFKESTGLSIRTLENAPLGLAAN